LDSTRSIAYQHTDDGMREPQYDSASTTSLAVGSSAPSSAQTSIEIDNFDIWDIEAGRDLVREKFSKIKTEQRHKMEALEKQTPLCSPFRLVESGPPQNPQYLRRAISLCYGDRGAFQS